MQVGATYTKLKDTIGSGKNKRVNWLGFKVITVAEVVVKGRVEYKCEPCGCINWDDDTKNTAKGMRIEREYLCLADGEYTTLCEDEMFYMNCEGFYKLTPPNREVSYAH